MTAIVLAGGKSSRMGFDKAFVKVEDTPIIKRQLRLLKKFFKKIIIVTNKPHKYRLSTVKVIQDIIPECGPLSGIYSGLLASDSFYNFVIACDMPYINLDLIKYMYKQAVGFDVVVPKLNHKYEPLFCIYSQNCLRYIKRSLHKKVFKISKFFPYLKLKEIKKREIVKFGSPETTFMNINTKEDLIRL